ncbi:MULTISPECIES: hypothetical protein [unclassified Embleya]|uniref:hypothetical protein n=1 Tax=unclassified Embleya TaxID=2699296 RepID=UPI0036B337B6
MDIEEQRERQQPKESAGEGVEQADRAARWGKLPERVAAADQVEELPADPPNDPEFGRNADNDWMLRYTP